MRNKIILAIAIMGISTPIFATSLKGEYPVCVSEDAFERLIAILEHDDKEALGDILKTECFMPKAGLKVDKVESMGWTSGVSHVKVYFKGKLYDLWTNTENLSN
ncbi:hypothetical protein WCU84_10105 [Dickeya chrysanthemi]|uniref:Lipoprotein n=1 Tax=Dickeya chrysanthemi TaxID=556 RepID=A0ABU8JKN4_DICCH